MDFRAFLFAIPQADAAAPSHLLRASHSPCLCVALLQLSLVHPGALYTASFASIRKQLPVVPLSVVQLRQSLCAAVRRMFYGRGVGGPFPSLRQCVHVYVCFCVGVCVCLCQSALHLSE